MDISSQEIEAIVKQVLSGMGGTPTASPSAAAPRCSTCGDRGVFENVDDAVEAAWKAQRDWVTNYKVEDRQRIIDAVGRHALGQGMQNGNTAAHTGLKQVIDVFLLRKLQQLAAVLRHQLLVGGDDVLARHQRPLRVFVGRLHAADG